MNFCNKTLKACGAGLISKRSISSGDFGNIPDEIMFNIVKQIGTCLTIHYISIDQSNTINMGGGTSGKILITLLLKIVVSSYYSYRGFAFFQEVCFFVGCIRDQGRPI